MRLRPCLNSAVVLVSSCGLPDSTFASPLNHSSPSTDLPPSILNALPLGTTVPAIDPKFKLLDHWGTDRIKGSHAYANAVGAVRDIALQNDYNGREPEHAYRYVGGEDVTINIRGWPSSSFYRRYALWAIVSSIGAMSRRPIFVSARFTMKMQARTVGELWYRGPNTPAQAINEDASMLSASANSSAVDDLDMLATPFDEDSASVAPTLLSKRALPPLSPFNATVLPLGTSTPLTRRPGTLIVIPNFSGTPMSIRAFTLATIGGMVYVARNNTLEPARHFAVDISGFGGVVQIDAPGEMTDPPFLNMDVVNGLAMLVKMVGDGRVWEECVADVGWRTAEALFIFGRFYVYATPRPEGGDGGKGEGVESN
ncbi:uncharacterized protein KY384_003955 [Bacidia gigantensis]|uniref:uncharacterized protein n=1 Tax=Bacidia gigantensis TaxID=2732470 RepID=UPI001D05A422|nr:uncharacterized protein KY384_003955 [Bacidia gigantensis]KAG8532314.1 hypothetical protein KY384_003955 [Bacidia gigantensis]